MNIVIIIPTFNRKLFVKNLLIQINEQLKLIKNVSFKVVLVVDGSTDGTMELVLKEFPHVHIVEGDGMWWYTRSMNEGFKYAVEHFKPNFFLTLNDDIILSTNYLQIISDLALENRDEAIIGSLGITYDKPHRIVSSGNIWKNKYFGIYKSYLPFLSQTSLDNLKGIYPTLTLPGRGMLIPIDAIVKLKFFDKKFKQYHSDGDFTLRALKVGLKVFISWDAKVYVNLLTTSASSSFLKKRFSDVIKSFFKSTTRNYLPSKALFIWRHNPKILFIPIVFLFIFSTFRKYFKFRGY